MEEKLSEAFNAELVRILLNTNEAKLLLTGYSEGKGLTPPFKVKGEFTITIPEKKSE